ncbi:MAG: aminoglycoside phosphotransferase family protein [Eubacteriales bacterium]|nr:aminoglycoside phosphotransferase family protein [Eubacteriales bacterium]
MKTLANGQAYQEIWNVSSFFDLEGELISVEPHGNGHINRTYMLCSTTGKRYILQKLSDAFDIEKLMANVSSVITYIKEHFDPSSTMNLVYTKNGKSYHHDENGDYRVFDFVEHSKVLQNAETAEDFYQSAIAFGSFQNMLADFPAETLSEPIVNFHNTIDRYRIFHETLERDPMGRAKEVEEEIAFVLSEEEEAGTLQRMRESGQLPLRVTHNDTKLNNVLLDKESGKPICVIDLDTVMPGLSVYDYGDSIRFGASTALEDEQDLSKVLLDLDLFRIYTKGFLEACPNLTEEEIAMLPMGAKIMTLECGVRFLTDHIDGDHYFNIHKEGQNLDRARTQFKLVQEMEAHWDEMHSIVKELAARIR